MNLDIIITILGISGVLAIALNFILEISNKLDKDHHFFALINLYGSIMLGLYSLYFKVWLFVVLNAFLVFVGIYGLYKVYFKK